MHLYGRKHVKEGTLQPAATLHIIKTYVSRMNEEKRYKIGFLLGTQTFNFDNDTSQVDIGYEIR